MKAVLASYRRSRHRIHPHYGVIHIDGVESKGAAEKLVGKGISWTAPGKLKTTIKGKITAAHGNNGRVRALFERGLPGQALGTELKIE